LSFCLEATVHAPNHPSDLVRQRQIKSAACSPYTCPQRLRNGTDERHADRAVPRISAAVSKMRIKPSHPKALFLQRFPKPAQTRCGRSSHYEWVTFLLTCVGPGSLVSPYWTCPRPGSSAWGADVNTKLVVTTPLSESEAIIAAALAVRRRPTMIAEIAASDRVGAASARAASSCCRHSLRPRLG
jgi:hypothetical protein